MLQLLFRFAFISAFFYSFGCAQNAKYGATKLVENREASDGPDVVLPSVPSITTRYVLKLHPSLLEADLQVYKVEVELSHKDDEYDDKQIRYMEPISGSGRVFEVEVPRYSKVGFFVWLGQDKIPTGETYCGEVHMYTDGLHADQTGQLTEEKTILISIPSNNMSSSYGYCLYKRLPYDDL